MSNQDSVVRVRSMAGEQGTMVVDSTNRQVQPFASFVENTDLMARRQDQEPLVALRKALETSFKSMEAADDVFRRELISCYGETQAADARYKSRHAVETVQSAADAYVAASYDWQRNVRAVRKLEGR